MKKPRIIFRKQQASPPPGRQNFDELMFTYRRASKRQMWINTLVLALEVVLVMAIALYVLYRFNQSRAKQENPKPAGSQNMLGHDHRPLMQDYDPALPPGYIALV